MALQSKLFAGDPKLEAAALSDPAHISPGARGLHVEKIQKALVRLDSMTIAAQELEDTFYGTSTANAVLSYKKKRAIINRSYQSSADNIVGKMTMTSLDRDVAMAELIVRTPIILPISPPPRPVRADFLIEARRSAFAARTFAPDRSQAALASFNLFGAVPSFPRSQLEINTSDTGTFQIIGGKGEIVFVENFRVGLLLDQQDARREKAQLDITSDGQAFTVRGKAPGLTRILVTKHEGFFNNAGTVSMALVVNELTVQKLWKPTLNAVRIPPRKRSPFMIGTQLGVQIAAEKFSFEGSVDPRPEINLSDFEIGFVQTLTESMMEAVYTDGAGGQRRIFETTCQKLPVRDSLGATPWTKPNEVKDLSVAKTVRGEDRPANVVPWQPPDKRVTLRRSSGADKFVTFFIARHKRTGAVTVLARAHWQTSWEYSFEFSREEATPIGRDGDITVVEVAPVGGVQPILGGDTALNTLVARFRP